MSSTSLEEVRTRRSGPLCRKTIEVDRRSIPTGAWSWPVSRVRRSSRRSTGGSIAVAVAEASAAVRVVTQERSCRCALVP